MMYVSDKHLAQKCPIMIPNRAHVQHDQKSGYQQIEYNWNDDGWNYTARWHSVLPGAKIITYPSWQVERVRPGLGYGKDHHPRLQQTLSSDGQWIDTDAVHQAAWRLGHNKDKSGDKKLILATHFHVN